MRCDDKVWDKCWRKWSSKNQYEQDIQQHLQERGPLYKFLRQALDNKVGSPLKVLEAGCGTAIDAYVLMKDSRVRVVGLDRAKAAIDIAREISPSFEQHPKFVVGDTLSLPFQDETFDVVFSQGLLEHFHDPMPALYEQVRVLKPSGDLIVDVPQKYAGLGLYSLRKQLKIRKGTWEWGWETQYSYTQLKKMAAAVGLFPVGIAGYGFDGLFNFLANPHIMIEKKAYLQRSSLAQAFKRFYLRYLKTENERLWNWLCRRYGHWFLISIVVWLRRR